MKIIIGGAGAVGTHLAELLSSEKQDIILMDEDKDKLSAMDSNFDLMTVCASPTSIQALKNAGVKNIKMMNIVAAPEGVEAVLSVHPDVQIYAASLDRELNSHSTHRRSIR